MRDEDCVRRKNRFLVKPRLGLRVYKLTGNFFQAPEFRKRMYLARSTNSVIYFNERGKIRRRPQQGPLSRSKRSFPLLPTCLSNKGATFL